MANGDHFEDEHIRLGGINDYDEPPAEPTKIQFDGLKIATSKAERRRRRRRRRNERMGKIAACIILMCIIIAIILSITLVKETEHILYQDSLYGLSESPSMTPTEIKPTIYTTPSPTVAPKPTFSVMTLSPTVHRTTSPNTAPTSFPTKSPAPTDIMENEYNFDPVADTYLYLDGSNKGKIYGHEATLWLQRGNKESTLPGKIPTISNIVGIVQFDTTKRISTNDKALPNRSRWPEQLDQIQVTLRIHHVPKNDLDDEIDELSVEDQLPVKMEIYRLPNNDMMVIESLTGDDFQRAPKEVTEGVLVGQHLVEATDTILDFDVTSAIFLTSDQITNNSDITAYTDDQVLFLLKVSWTESSRQGGQFETRESDYGSPQLIFSNMT